MIAVGNNNQKIKINTDGIIVIVCLCCHFWGRIIVYPYFMWLHVLFEIMKQNNVLMSLQLYILLIQLNVNKAFTEEVETYMYTTFCEIAQPFNKAILAKKIHVCSH